MALNFAPSTWRALGITTCATLTGLGFFALAAPAAANAELGVPRPGTVDQAERADWTMRLLGGRDLCISGLMGYYLYQRKNEEAGKLLLSVLPFALLDVYAVAKLKDVAASTPYLLATAWAGFVSYGLLLES